MDTKLKNSKFNPIIKAIILILTLVFAFLAGTNALELARKTIYFNNETEIQNTPVYKENIQETLRNLLYRGNFINIRENYYSQNLTFEQFCETSELAKNIKIQNEETQNKALDYFYQISEIKKLEPKNDGTFYDAEEDLFYDQYDNSYYSLENFKESVYFENNPYSESQEPVTSFNPDITQPYTQQVETTVPPTEITSSNTNKIYKTHAEWEYEYQKLRNNIFSLVNDARSRETIKAELEADLKRDLENAYAEEAGTLAEVREEYQNIDFLLLNKSSGYYISSFSEDAQIENFKNNLKNNAFALCTI